MTSIDVRRRKYSSRRYTKVLVRRLKTGELHHKYSMTLQKRTTRCQISPRTINYESPPTQHNLYAIILSHRLYKTIIELSGYQREESRSKRQISVQFNASRMKKNDPTLPT